MISLRQYIITLIYIWISIIRRELSARINCGISSYYASKSLLDFLRSDSWKHFVINSNNYLFCNWNQIGVTGPDFVSCSIKMAKHKIECTYIQTSPIRLNLLSVFPSSECASKAIDTIYVPSWVVKALSYSIIACPKQAMNVVSFTEFKWDASFNFWYMKNLKIEMILPNMVCVSLFVYKTVHFNCPNILAIGFFW